MSNFQILYVRKQIIGGAMNNEIRILRLLTVVIVYANIISTHKKENLFN